MKILEGNYPLLDTVDIYLGDQYKLQMKIIEQSLLMAQFDSLKLEDEKSAMKILKPNARKIPNNK